MSQGASTDLLRKLGYRLLPGGMAGHLLNYDVQEDQGILGLHKTSA